MLSWPCAQASLLSFEHLLKDSPHCVIASAGSILACSICVIFCVISLALMIWDSKNTHTAPLSLPGVTTVAH